MDFNVKVKEKLTGTFSIGGGYSSVDKLMAIVEVSQGNLGGRGQLLKFKTQWGKVSQLFMLSFMEPYLFDKPVWGKVDVSKQSQDYNGYWLKTNGFALSAGKSFGEYVSTSLRFSYDNSLVTDIQTIPAFSLQRQLDIYGDRISTNALTWSISRIRGTIISILKPVPETLPMWNMPADRSAATRISSRPWAIRHGIFRCSGTPSLWCAAESDIWNPL